MYSILVTPKFGDTDGLMHINNNVMPGWFEQARNPIYGYFNPEFSFKTWNLILAHYEIDFIAQMYYGKDAEVRSWISRIGRSSFEVYQECWQESVLAVKGKTVLVNFDFKTQKSIPIPPEIRLQMERHLWTEKA